MEMLSASGFTLEDIQGSPHFPYILTTQARCVNVKIDVKIDVNLDRSGFITIVHTLLMNYAKTSGKN